MKEMNKKRRRNSELSRKNESAKNIFKFANCSVRKGIEAESKKKEDKTVKNKNKSNNSEQVKVNKGKNSILEEFMKNKQEKIRHSKIISQSIGESLWFKNSLFSNNKMSNDNKENNNTNTFEIVNNEPVSNPNNKINDKYINELDILNSFKFDSSNENSIEEEKDKTESSKSNEKVIHLDSLSIISNGELRSENESEFEIEKNTEIEGEVIPIDLDIPKDTKTFSESEIETSIKNDIINKLGENFLTDLISFIKTHINPDLEDYSYDRLINQLQNQFSSVYPKAKIDNAITYIPDIQFLIISSQKM